VDESGHISPLEVLGRMLVALVLGMGVA